MGGGGFTVPVVETGDDSGAAGIALGIRRIVGQGWQGSGGGDDEGKKPYRQEGEVDCSIE